MIAPKKSLGQNFLRDENVARNIVERLSLRRDDPLVEIGPGTGALTRHLLGQVDHLVVVEIDQRAVTLLRERFGDACTVIHADVREIEPRALVDRSRGKVRVVGNIPYYITSEVLFWIFDHHTDVLDAMLMMQLEVAKRLTARTKTKEYGILSVFSQLYAEPEILFRVSRNSFYPKPAVDSAVVRLRVRDTLPPHNERLFRNIVRSTFGKRRKTLFNGLRYMGFSEELLGQTKLNLQRRPEELEINDFLELSKALEPHHSALAS